MPRYRFHIHDGARTTDDPAGHEFPDDASARREAIKALAAVAAEEVPKDGDRTDISVHVTDEAGAPLFSATIAFHVDAVAKSPPAAPANTSR
jgi:hypothetical protein